jgi:hypothetical protein
MPPSRPHLLILFTPQWIFDRFEGVMLSMDLKVPFTARSHDPGELLSALSALHAQSRMLAFPYSIAPIRQSSMQG